MKKRIHVNQHAIKRNNKLDPKDHEPPITVKTYKDNHKGKQVIIGGWSTLVYRPEQPLSCGARLWIETEAPVSVDGEMIY